MPDSASTWRAEGPPNPTRSAPGTEEPSARGEPPKLTIAEVQAERARSIGSCRVQCPKRIAVKLPTHFAHPQTHFWYLN